MAQPKILYINEVGEIYYDLEEFATSHEDGEKVFIYELKKTGKVTNKPQILFDNPKKTAKKASKK